MQFPFSPKLFQLRMPNLATRFQSRARRKIQPSKCPRSGDQNILQLLTYGLGNVWLRLWHTSLLSPTCEWSLQIRKLL